MSEVYDLFFELSNEERITILTELEREPQKLTQLSTKLELSNQEISRQLNRLFKINLIQKDVDGLHHLTPFASSALNLMSSYAFLTKNREYFTTHTPLRIPQDHLMSIGFLVETKFSDDVLMNFYYLEKMMQEAEDYIWLMTDQILTSLLPLAQKKRAEGVVFKQIVWDNINLPPTFYDWFSDKRELFQQQTPEKATRKFTKNLGIIIAMSEKEVSQIFFPDIEGRFDYKGFRSQSKNALDWGKKIFLDYWDKATTKIPDHIVEGLGTARARACRV